MRHVRYIVVVHGIGEQRPNETVLAVINRIAEARNPGLEPRGADVVTLGMASGQVPPRSRESRPWLEFEGIPLDAGEGESSRPFFGRPAFTGDNIRFFDLLWSGIMKESIGQVGQPPEEWVDALIGRLERKNSAAGRDRSRRVPLWATEILRLIRQLVVLLRTYLSWGARDVDELIFTRFLGDVQLYGEYPICRGRAVRRFHEELSLLERAHDRSEEQLAARARDRGEVHEKREARFTVLAHSLGTVMSMDALLHAHADRDLRAGRSPESIENLPFPGYMSDGERRLHDEWVGQRAGKGTDDELPDEIAFLDTSWVDRVDAFVTLGSPIDKYLVLWWLNYKYLACPDQWVDDAYRRKLQDSRERIPHYNYCEEQDPVGHELDVAYTAPAFDRIFVKAEDRLYCRSAAAGFAHVAYWKDLELFQRILEHGIDRARRGRSVEDLRMALARDRGIDWFVPAVFDRILRFTYKIIPALVMGLDFFAFTWAWFSNSWHGTVLATVLLVATCWIGRVLLDLNVWWRRVLLAKRPRRSDRPPLRTAKEKRFRLLLHGWKYVTLVATAVLSWFYLSRPGVEMNWGRAAFIAVVAALLVGGWILLRGGSGKKMRGFWTVDVPTVLWPTGAVLLGLAASWLEPWEAFHLRVDGWVRFLGSNYSLSRELPVHFDDLVFSTAALAAVAATVFTYLNARFFFVKKLFAREPEGMEIHFQSYALDG